jgi:hypothetical protein
MRKEITQADIEEYLVTQSDFDLELFVAAPRCSTVASHR